MRDERVKMCICRMVSMDEIKKRLDNGEELSDIMEQTRAGDGCGLCVPYMEQLVEETQE